MALFRLPFRRWEVNILVMANPETPWPHAPTHQLSEQGCFFVTSRTYEKAHYFRSRERLDVLQRGLLTVAQDFGWRLEAWAVFSNHYHFVGNSPEKDDDAASLAPMLKMLHAKTAVWINRLDHAAERKVWFNYRETRLSYQNSYLARLNYVHQNAVKHGAVPVANQYPWCSAAWFENVASKAMVDSIYRFKTDAVRVEDDYEVEVAW